MNMYEYVYIHEYIWEYICLQIWGQKLEIETNVMHESNVYLWLPPVLIKSLQHPDEQSCQIFVNTQTKILAQMDTRFTGYTNTTSNWDKKKIHQKDAQKKQMSIQMKLWIQ